MRQDSILVLTRDSHFQEMLGDVLNEFDGRVLYASDIGDALQLVHRHSGSLDLAVIEFADGCHGMTLLHAIDMCQADLPIIVITAGHCYDAMALLCSKELGACLTKPVRQVELEIAVREVLAANTQLQTG